MPAQIFQHAADEIAHVDQGDVRQAVKLLHRGFRRRSGRTGEVGDAACACHIDALIDGMNPGRAGIRDDDSGRAQDRKAADDAQTRAERARRQGLSARNRDLHLDVESVTCTSDFRDRFADHLTRHWIDRGFARRNRQAGTRHRADAFPGSEDNTGAWRGFSDGREHQRAMGHVRVVAGILDDAGGGGMSVLPREGKRERGALAFRQSHFHGIRKFPGEQRRVGGLGRRSGACARGPTSAQRRIVHWVGYNARIPRRHSCGDIR